MRGKLFTLDEANRLLPLVRSITRDAVGRYGAAKEAIRELDRLKGRMRAAGLSAAEALDRQERVIEGHLTALRRLIDELERLGCRLRDYERGAVDFPAAALDEGGFIVYCWALGEPDISHWHSEHEGFAERRDLPAAASP